MREVVLVIHVLLAIILVAIVLLQRSEGGALGIGGGGPGGGLVSARGAANLLTRATAIIAGAFMLTSITLTILAGGQRTPTSILDTLPSELQPPAEQQAPQQPVQPPAKTDSQKPEVPISDE